MRTAVQLSDTEVSFTVELLQGVARVRSGFPSDPDLVIELGARCWRQILLGLITTSQARRAGRLCVLRGEDRFKEFSRRFETGFEIDSPALDRGEEEL